MLPYRPNVGIMLVNQTGGVFVAQRLDSPGSAWQMPQGGIDSGEEPRGAALRELEEETGVSPEQVDVLGALPEWLYYDFPADLVSKVAKGRFKGQKQRWFLMRFLGSDSDINIDTEHPEFSEWKWVEHTQLVANIVPFKRDVYQRVIDEFKPLF